MNNAVSPAGKAGNVEEIILNEDVTELSEDMEMVSPGAMIREAREALSFSQQHIASKLNFKVSIVNDIENDIFDPTMPVTFIRGYLVNYAKLVGVEVDDVLASYDVLNAATIQRSEMLSFSKETTKQAEHSRVMWLSYLVVAVLIGLTILWWLQESRHQTDDLSNVTATTMLAISATETETEKNSDASALNVEQGQTENSTKVNDKLITADSTVETVVQTNNTSSASVAVSTESLVNKAAPDEVPAISTAVFTFKGDCWVNIFDATGERIAWGVKKAGYVMTIQGKAPLRITVGKPELTSIIFNGQAVDMSAFNIGNIAKFNLPIVE